jgi:hypothetical protein
MTEPSLFTPHVGKAVASAETSVVPARSGEVVAKTKSGNLPNERASEPTRAA